MKSINDIINEKLKLNKDTKLIFSPDLLKRKNRGGGVYSAAFILEHIEDAKQLLNLLNNTSRHNVLYLWANALGEIDDDKIYSDGDLNEDELIEKIKDLSVNEFINTETPADREINKI